MLIGINNYNNHLIQKDMNTTENNKLIAEFMELHFSNGAYHHKKTDRHALEWIKEDHLKFHTSWGWLMPVVEKIESLERDNQKLLLELIGNRAKFIGEFGCRYFDDSIGETKIEAAYKAVVEFIKWYNKQ